MIDKNLARQVLDAALSRGGSFAELFLEDRLSHDLMLRSSALESATTGRTHGAGVRIFAGEQVFYVYTNDTSLEGLIRCAQDAAAAAARVGLSPQPPQGLIGSVAPNAHLIQMLPGDVPGADKVGILREISEAARAYSPEISQVVVRAVDWDQRVTIANSRGLFVSDRRVYTRLASSAVASSGSENQSGFYGPGAMRGWEHIMEQDAQAIGAKIAEQAVTMLHAPYCPAGEMPVVIDGGFGGVIFHEACGHSLESVAIAKNLSEFCGCMDTQIASDRVTAVDDGTLPGQWGSQNIDDEGTPTQRIVLIERGMLRSYMNDIFDGERMGMTSTGSGRRESYAYAPVARMHNTYIAAGEDDEEEMIRTMGDGLYAKSMGGGSVNPVTGEFNFSVSEGYLVKDGKIDHPVRGASLIGRGSQILKRIDRVGRHMTMEQGMCGSYSGSVPTNVGQPRIRVSSLTVGGK